MLRLLLPESHDALCYEAEPFVLPADVYSAEGREGTAGWTWYTGSAGWYFRAACEGLLGLRLRDGKLCAGPAALDRFTVRWRDFRGKAHLIEAENQTRRADGKDYPGEGIG